MTRDRSSVLGRFRRVVSGTGMTFGMSLEGWEVRYLEALVDYSQERALIIDLAPSYGQGLAESLFGQWASRADQVAAATKLRIPDYSSQSADQSLMQSLYRLRRDSVELLSTHWSGTEDEFLSDVDFLLGARQSNLAHFVGLGNPSRRDLELLKARGLAGEFDFIQSEYSLCDRTVMTDLEECDYPVQQVLGYSALCEGRLGPSKESVMYINRLAADSGVLNSAIVLRSLMQDPRVMPMTVSTNVERHLSNLGAEGIDLSNESIEVLLRKLAESSIKVRLGTIRIDPERLRGPCFKTAKEARENTLGLSPSPLELAASLGMSERQLKPLKVASSPGSSDSYVLLQGQLRYWALVLAFGKSHLVDVTVLED